MWKDPYVNPARCVSRSSNVIGRSAGSVWWSGPDGERRTRIAENSGAQREIGSDSAMRPSSTRVSAATDVIGFVIEAIRKIVSGSTGRPASRSRHPTQACWTTSPPRQIRVVAPARPPALTTASMAVAIEPSGSI